MRVPGRAALAGCAFVLLLLAGAVVWWLAPDREIAELAATPRAAGGSLAASLPGTGWDEVPVRELRRLGVDDARANPVVRASPECEAYLDLERQLVLQNPNLVRAYRETTQREEPPARLIRVTRTTADFVDAGPAEAGLAAVRSALGGPAAIDCLTQGLEARGQSLRVKAIPFPSGRADADGDVTLGLRLVGPEGSSAEEYVVWWQDGASLRTLVVSVGGPSSATTDLTSIIVAARGRR